MVSPVVADPMYDGPLGCHRAENDQNPSDCRMGLEGMVGEMAVEANGNSQQAEDVQNDRRNQGDGADADRGQECDRDRRSRQRHQHGDKCERPL